MIALPGLARTMSEEGDLKASWTRFFRAECAESVRELVDDYPAERSLHVDLLDLYGHDESFAQALLAEPERYLAAGKEALGDVDDSVERVNLRLTNNPGMVAIGQVRSKHVSELVTVEALVGTVDRVQSAPVEAVYRCGHCGNRVGATSDRRAVPGRCPECGVEGTLAIDVPRSTLVDVQRVELEPPPEDRSDDDPPVAIDAVLDDDLVGTVGPDDRVLVTGIVGLDRSSGADRFDFRIDVVSVQAARGETSEPADVPSALKRSIHERWQRTVDW